MTRIKKKRKKRLTTNGRRLSKRDLQIMLRNLEMPKNLVTSMINSRSSKRSPTKSKVRSISKRERKRRIWRDVSEIEGTRLSLKRNWASKRPTRSLRRNLHPRSMS